jgi:hypothetical protein
MQRYKLSTFIIVFIFVNSILGLQCPVGFDSMPPGVPLGICVIVGCSKPIKDQLCSENCIEGYTKTQSQSC